MFFSTSFSYRRPGKRRRYVDMLLSVLTMLALHNGGRLKKLMI
ncbi:unnamed protein product [Brassica oleracea var. botrytis]